MKRGTPDHPKMKRLSRTLDINRAWAVGILESLWHWAGRFAQQGDIGKHPNEDIAEAVYWNKAPQILIDALVLTGWLELSDEFRLIIHDWHDHAEEAVRKYLERNNMPFLTRRTPSRQCLDKDATASASREAIGDRRQAIGDRRVKGGAGGKRSSIDYSPEYEAFWLAVAIHKRNSKLDGWKAYQETVKQLASRNGDPHVFLLDRAKAYYASPFGKTPYCHGPGPFLRQGDFDGDPVAWQRKTNQQSSWDKTAKALDELCEEGKKK